jgi:2-iminobutanoate/2-iminopropanoate deaminase
MAELYPVCLMAPSTSSIVCANSPNAARPAGHYSHTCTAAGLVFVSGILPISVEGKALAGEPFETQTRQVLANLEACLEGVGIGKTDLVQVRVYVTDIEQWPEFNRLYAEWIGEHKPARAVAGVLELHFGLAVEVEAVALARSQA